MPTHMQHYQMATDAKKHEKYGYKLSELAFDTGVYGSLMYLVNGALSVVVAHQRVKPGWIKSTSEAIEGGFKSLGIKERHAETLTNLSFLSSGGWLLLAPTKWAEDAKPDIVKWFDKQFGTEPNTPEKQAAQQERFDSFPKQSYGSLLLGRALSIPPLIGGMAYWFSNSSYQEKSHEISTKYLSKFFNKFPAADRKLILANIADEATMALLATVMLYGLSKGTAFARDNFFDNGNGNTHPTPNNAVDAHTVAHAANIAKEETLNIT